jgi:hypothetical protein
MGQWWTLLSYEQGLSLLHTEQVHSCSDPPNTSIKLKWQIIPVLCGLFCLWRPVNGSFFAVQFHSSCSMWVVLSSLTASEWLILCCAISISISFIRSNEIADCSQNPPFCLSLDEHCFLLAQERRNYGGYCEVETVDYWRQRYNIFFFLLRNFASVNLDTLGVKKLAVGRKFSSFIIQLVLYLYMFHSEQWNCWLCSQNPPFCRSLDEHCFSLAQERRNYGGYCEVETIDYWRQRYNIYFFYLEILQVSIWIHLG